MKSGALKILFYFFLFVLFGCEKEDLNPNIDFFNEIDGLPDPYVLAVGEDLEGTLWISTRGGVACYDGSEIELKFDSLFVFDRIIVDLSGNVWIGSKYYGYRPYRYDGIHLQRFDTYKTLFENVADNKSYYYSNYEIYYYHMNQWDTIPISYFPLFHQNCARYDIFLDSKENFWVATNDYCSTGIYKFDGEQWVDFNTREIFSSRVGNNIYKVIEDRNNEILVSSGSQILKYANDQWSIYLDLWKEDEMPTFTQDLFEDSRGNLWFGIYDYFQIEGILYNYDGRCINQIDLSEYPKSGNSRLITCVFEDSRGHIWVGTADGLFRIRK